MTCTVPSGEKVLTQPVLGGELWREIARAIRGLDRCVAAVYGYSGGETFILVLYVDNGRVVGACYDSGRETLQGDEAVRRVSPLLSGEAGGLIEVVRPSAWRVPRPVGLSRPRPLEELARPAAEAGQRGERPGGLALEDMDGLQVGMLLSDVILRSRLLASTRRPEDAIRRARQESRRDRRGFYRVAVFLDDGSVYNIFIKEGRIRRVIYLSPSGIEGRVLRRDENIRDILRRLEGRVRGASVYRVECPECEKIIIAQ